MSDSQRFPVAAHALAYLAHKQAYGPEKAAPSATLAASVPTNPVVIRRVTAMLAKAGLIATRPGANGGAWLLRPAAEIDLSSWDSSSFEAPHNINFGPVDAWSLPAIAEADVKAVCWAVDNWTDVGRRLAAGLLTHPAGIRTVTNCRAAPGRAGSPKSVIAADDSGFASPC